MRTLLFTIAISMLGLGCGTGTEHVNALTGEVCVPDSSYIPRAKPAHANNGQGHECQGTSNGDNCDDLSSGKIDCIGDGNSGQGDDKKHNCEFPQPGCDENGCCDEDMVDPQPDPEPEPEPEPDPDPEPEPDPDQPLPG